MDENLAGRIREAANREKDFMIAVRRDLHAHPEVAFKEVRTSRIVADEMERLGLEVRREVARTGAVGLLRGGRPGRTVALRADLDALPFDDGKDVPYRSTVPGAAHLCGHDAHAAMLLGAARVLISLRDELAGNVKFLAEPAEEMANAAGVSGAQMMIADGALDNPQVDAIFAAHVFPEHRTGVVAVRAGSIMAGHAKFELNVLGREAHAATPQLAVDAVAVAARLIQALQSVGNNAVEPGEAFALNVGVLKAGHAYNLIPGRAELVGSVRTGNEALRPHLGAMLEKVVAGICQAAGAEYEFRLDPYTFPATSNDPALAALVRDVAIDLHGPDAVTWLDRPRFTGETFCYYLDRVPGTYFILGTGNPEKGTTLSSHHPRFDIDEDALPAGAAVLAGAALQYLRSA